MICPVCNSINLSYNHEKSNIFSSVIMSNIRCNICQNIYDIEGTISWILPTLKNILPKFKNTFGVIGSEVDIVEFTKKAIQIGWKFQGEYNDTDLVFRGHYDTIRNENDLLPNHFWRSTVSTTIKYYLLPKQIDLAIQALSEKI